MKTKLHKLGLLVIITLLLSACDKQMGECPPPLLETDLIIPDSATRAYADLYQSISTLVFINSSQDSIVLNSKGPVEIITSPQLLDTLYCDADSTEMVANLQFVSYKFESAEQDSAIFRAYSFVPLEDTPQDYLAYVAEDNILRPPTKSLFTFSAWFNNGTSLRSGSAMVNNWEGNTESGREVEYFKEITIDGISFEEVYKISCCQGTFPREEFYSLSQGVVAYWDNENSKYWVLKNRY